jgi:Do/DeqQ family serine protease
MKKQGLILVLAVFSTAIISTSFAFFLFQKFATPQQVYFHEKAQPAKLTNFETKSDKKSPTKQNTASDSIDNAPTKTNSSASALPDNFVIPSAKVRPAVVNITAMKGGYRASTGSGVILSSDGYIITNNHVVEGASVFNVTLNNNRELEAVLVGTDKTTDLALLKVQARNLENIDFGDSDDIKVGEWVLAVGNPFNLASTVTAGIVSAKGRNINIIEGDYSIESFIQTDAVVNPGNSGGALVNTRGELVGINTAILSETGGYEGYSFAIPSNLVQKVIEDLKDYGQVQRAILGVRISDINDDLASDLDLPSVAGVLINGVNEGSSAADAGLRSGDVIVGVNGRNTNSTAELQEQVAQYRPGDSISIDYIRAGRRSKKGGVKLKGINNATAEARRRY